MRNQNYNQYKNTVNNQQSKPSPSDKQPIKDQVEGRFEFKPLNPGDIPKSKNHLVNSFLIIGVFVVVFGALIALMLFSDI